MKTPQSTRIRRAYLLAGLLTALAIAPSPAVMLKGSGDPTFNTTAPTGDLADSGWQYQGQWGSFLGTPIGEQYFIAAKHVGGAVGAAFVFNGVTYKTTAYWDDPTGTDLRIWKVDGLFPIWAPLYSLSDESGKPLVVIGRGTQRGAEVNVPTVQTTYTTNLVTTNYATSATVSVVDTTCTPQLVATNYPTTTTNCVVDTICVTNLIATNYPTSTTVSAVATLCVTNLVATNYLTSTTVSVVNTVCATNLVATNYTTSATVSVVQTNYTTNVYSLKRLGLTAKQAQKLYPTATIKGDTVTVVTSKVVTKQVVVNSIVTTNVPVVTCRPVTNQVIVTSTVTTNVPVVACRLVTNQVVVTSTVITNVPVVTCALVTNQVVVTGIITTNVPVMVCVAATNWVVVTNVVSTNWLVVTSGVVTNQVTKGWKAGAGDGLMRWGENRVAVAGKYLAAAFDANGGDNEASLSSGDSSGAVFIAEGGLWKLAGINYGIEGPFQVCATDASFYGGILDKSGLYQQPLADGNLRPACFYATRISARLDWITTVLSQ